MEKLKGFKMFEVSNSLYNDLYKYFPEDADNFVFHKVCGLTIPFSLTWRQIGINISGGADSASLCLLLCKIIKENNYKCKIHVITFVRCWTTRPWQEPKGHEVYQKLKSMFPKIIGNRYENYIPPELEYGVIGPIIKGRSGDQIEGSSFNSYVAYKHKLSAIFNGTSMNPSDEVFDNRMKERDKTSEQGTLRDIMYHDKGTWFIHPYRFVQKDWIVAQYFIHGAEDLFNTTRGCEGDINDGNHINPVVPTLESYKPGMDVPVCGACFWCLERDWAVSKLPDTMNKLRQYYE